MLRMVLLTVLCVPALVAAQEPAPGPESIPEAVSAPVTDAVPGESAMESDDVERTVTESGQAQVKQMLGMSILGNEEAPQALVIVPWKSSRIGDGPGVTNSMDDRASPVDREVFLREVRYYELRSGGE